MIEICFGFLAKGKGIGIEVEVVDPDMIFV